MPSLTHTAAATITRHMGSPSEKVSTFLVGGPVLGLARQARTSPAVSTCTTLGRRPCSNSSLFLFWYQVVAFICKTVINIYYMTLLKRRLSDVYLYNYLICTARTMNVFLLLERGLRLFCSGERDGVCILEPS